MDGLLDMYLVEPSLNVIKVHDPLEVDSEVRNKPTTFLVTHKQAEAMFSCVSPNRDSTLRWCGACFEDKQPSY